MSNIHAKPLHRISMRKTLILGRFLESGGRREERIGYLKIYEDGRGYSTLRPHYSTQHFNDTKIIPQMTPVTPSPEKG